MGSHNKAAAAPELEDVGKVNLTGVYLNNTLKFVHNADLEAWVQLAHSDNVKKTSTIVVEDDYDFGTLDIGSLGLCEYHKIKWQAELYNEGGNATSYSYLYKDGISFLSVQTSSPTYTTLSAEASTAEAGEHTFFAKAKSTNTSYPTWVKNKYIFKKKCNMKFAK